MRTLATFITLLLLSTNVNAADWVRVETPNFVVFGEIGEKRTKEIAVEFERFREAMERVFPNAARAAVPTIVVAFASNKSFSPYWPRYNGKPVRVSGYFMGSNNDNLIGLTLEDRDVGLEVILHEYTHLIINNSSHAIPLWVNEGLAEFYSTFVVSTDGMSGMAGRPILPHYRLLLRNALVPFEQLLTVDESSPLYNEGQRRSIFYAQSWALVHVILAGTPNRSAQLKEYIRLSGEGVRPLEAWRQAFGTFDADAEVQRFLRNRVVQGLGYTFGDRIGSITPKVSPPMASDVEAVQAALLRYAAPDEAGPRLLRAANLAPPSKLARAMLGVIRERDSAEARKLLFEASDDKSDWLVQYYVACGLTEIVRQAFLTTPDEQIVSAARAAVDAVLAQRADLPHALAMKAELVKDIAVAARARALAPGRPDFVFIEARLRTEARDFAVARQLLAPLLAPNVRDDVRRVARDMMRQVDERERVR